MAIVDFGAEKAGGSVERTAFVLPTLGIENHLHVPAVVLLACLLSLSAGLPASGAMTSDQRAVVRATIAAVATRFPNSHTPGKVSCFTIVRTHALSTWSFGEGGGSAVLQKIASGWKVIGIGAGTMDADLLVAFGVPARIATRLAATLPPAPSPSP